MPASQAGRRGFDPRLPLFVLNNLGSPEINLYSVPTPLRVFTSLERNFEAIDRLNPKPNGISRKCNRWLHKAPEVTISASSSGARTALQASHLLGQEPIEYDFASGSRQPGRVLASSATGNRVFT